MLFASHASVVRTPSPPAFVMIAALFPNFGYFSRILATSNSCFIESTWMQPACFRIPSYTPDSDASAAVWDCAAFCPALDFPDFKTMIGFLHFLQVSMNRLPRPFFRDSKYRVITFVLLSFE